MEQKSYSHWQGGANKTSLPKHFICVYGIFILFKLVCITANNVCIVCARFVTRKGTDDFDYSLKNR